MSPSCSLHQAFQHPHLQTIATSAKGLGLRVLWVGGLVRDLLANKSLPSDLDVMVLDGSANTLAHALAHTLQGVVVALDTDYGIYRVVVTTTEGTPYTIDCAEAQGNDITQDLARRDLTINAMAYDPETATFIDPHGGRRDLANGCIRMVSQANLLDDPLRLLRVFRFAATIPNSTITPDTLAVVTQHKQCLLSAAPERISYELLRLLDQPACFTALQAMANSGLLEVILPELTPCRLVGPNTHHHLWLLDHTLELVNQLEGLLPTLPSQTLAHVSAPFNPTVSRLALTKLACLLHDVGKPETMIPREGVPAAVGQAPDRITFYGHEALSATMTNAIGKRLKWGNKLTQFVNKLVRWHLYPCQFGPSSMPKSVQRFLRRMGDEAPDVTLLALADRLSTLGPMVTPAQTQQADADHRWLMDQYHQQVAIFKQPPLLNGHQVMEALGLAPGPQLKQVLQALQIAQQAGELATPDQALAWLKTAHIPDNSVTHTVNIGDR
jgi:putative nucleotidyltransferase with HDIG domain